MASGRVLLYTGVALLVLVCICALVAVVLLRSRWKTLNQAYDKEYGPRPERPDHHDPKSKASD